MVVDYLDRRWTVFTPYKTDSILLIDSDTVLTGAITAECFQMVVGWYLQ